VKALILGWPHGSRGAGGEGGCVGLCNTSQARRLEVVEVMQRHHDMYEELRQGYEKPHAHQAGLAVGTCEAASR
jgi:hypothetical protein